MKYINKFEAMKIVNFKDLNDWTGDTTKMEKINLSRSDRKLAVKILETLNEYDLGIYSVEKQNFLSNIGLYPDENGLTEYRLTLGHVKTEKSVEDNYGEVPVKGDKYYNEYLEDLKKIGQIEETNEDLTYSFFTKNTNDQETLKAIGLIEGLKYLKLLLNTVKDAIEFSIDTWDVIRDIDDLKNYIDKKNITINNNNLELVLNCAVRIHKDSSFFTELKDYLGDSTYKNLINDLKIIK